MTGEATGNALPAGFDELLPFIGYWDVATSEERLACRAEATMEDMRAFYAVATRLGEAALSHLDEFDLFELPPASARLLRLMLALAQVAMAIELHGQPRVPHSPYPHQIRIVRAPAPFG